MWTRFTRVFHHSPSTSLQSFHGIEQGGFYPKLLPEKRDLFGVKGASDQCGDDETREVEVE
jgi:hypothetical protein